MLATSFELWAACQRLFNVTPAVVHDHRDGAGGGTVHFLATLNDADEVDVADSYDEEDQLALGFEDDDQLIRLVAARDTFLGNDCIVVVRSAESMLEMSCHAVEVTVFVDVTDATLARAIALVRETVTEDSFECLYGEYATREPEPAEGAEAAADDEPEPRPQQGRSLWDRLMGRYN
jgi:hypothetical protein